jgi:nitrate reductase gamma subunit
MERFTHLKKKKKGIEKKTLYTLSCAFHKQIIILIQGFFFFFFFFFSEQSTQDIPTSF